MTSDFRITMLRLALVLDLAPHLLFIFIASSVQSFVKTSSRILSCHSPLTKINEAAGFHQRWKKRKSKREREKRVVLGELVDYRISGWSNKTRATAKIFVSRGPIKPISASWMRVGRPRENSFDYFSANYGDGYTGYVWRTFAIEIAPLSEHGNELLGTRGKKNVFRGGFITGSTVIGTADGGETNVDFCRIPRSFRFTKLLKQNTI